MKQITVLIAIALGIAGYIYLFDDQSNHQPAITQGSELNASPSGQSEAQTSQTQSLSQDELTLEQQQQMVAIKEQRLMDMARDYDAIRDNKELKAQHSEEMKAKLAEYSADVLPVVMNEINQSTDHN